MTFFSLQDDSKGVAAAQERPGDDDVLKAIRNARKVVQQQFDEAMIRRKSTTTMSPNGLLQRKEKDKSSGGDNDENNEIHSWESECYRLKQKLYEEKKRSSELAEQHTKELAKANSRWKDAVAEASNDREMNSVLEQALDAQTKRSQVLEKQLAERRENSVALQVKWKDVIDAMEQEKESMKREREASADLLEETQRRLAAAVGGDPIKIHQPMNHLRTLESDRSQSLAKRVKELEIANARLAKENKELTSKQASPVEENTNAAVPEKETQQKQQQEISFCWDQSKTRSTLQEKLKELEESLAKNTETIQSLQHQIPAAKRLKNTMTKKGLQSTPNLLEAKLTKKQKQLDEKKDLLRKKSLRVVGDVMILQLQRLMEIHKQITREPAKDTAPVSTLQGIEPNVNEAFERLGIKTIGELATYKFFLAARYIKTQAEIESKRGRREDSDPNIDNAVDKPWRTKSPLEIINASTEAMMGIGKMTSGLLSSLGVKTVGDLAECKYFRWAESIVTGATVEELEATDDEWKSILQKLTQNRDKVFELRNGTKNSNIREITFERSGQKKRQCDHNDGDEIDTPKRSKTTPNAVKQSEARKKRNMQL